MRIPSGNLLVLNGAQMKTAAILGLAISGSAAALVLMAAQHPAALAGSKPGMWELSGVPGARTPVRECVNDVLALARYEHRGKACNVRVLSDGGSSTLLEYRCGGAGFGRSEIQVITPRNLKISTQGISDQLPFNYVLQARRVGECTDEPLAGH